MKVNLKGLTLRKLPLQSVDHLKANCKLNVKNCNDRINWLHGLDSRAKDMSLSKTSLT